MVSRSVPLANGQRSHITIHVEPNCHKQLNNFLLCLVHLLLGDARKGPQPVVFAGAFAEQDAQSLQSNRASIKKRLAAWTKMERNATCSWVHPRSPAPLPLLVMMLPAGTGHDAG